MKLRISDHAGNSAEICDLGAELKSFCVNGCEYIWQGDDTHWSGSSPFLFPIASNVRDDTVWMEGKPFHLTQHGFAKNKCWTPICQSEDAVTFSLKADADTLSVYPYHFVLEAAYIIRDGILTMTMTVRNEEPERDMPFCFGTHPAFCVPFDPESGSGFEDYRIILEKEEENSCPLYNSEKRQINVENREAFLEPDCRTLCLQYPVFDRVGTILFDKLRSRSAVLLDTKTGRKLSLSFPDFEYLAIWTDHAPFICIEPWQGLSACSDEGDEMIQKRGVQILSPGSSKQFRLEIRIEA